MAERFEVLVLGGGISGLAAANVLQARGCSYAVLEAASLPGGLSRTIELSGYQFDYTPHLLHLARHDSPAAVPYADLCDSEWMCIAKNSFCLLEGVLARAPLQYHLDDLPTALCREFRDSYLRRPAATDRPSSFGQYMRGSFGEAFAERFLLPLNRKTLAIDPDRLCAAAVTRFFPPPDEQRLLQGSAVATGEYNSHFWYPRHGGMARLVDGLSNGVTELVLNKEIVSIDFSNKKLTCADGSQWEWQSLLSSMPLPALCHIGSCPSLQQLGSHLSYSSVAAFQFGIRGRVNEQLREAHWVYCAEPELPFYRVGFPSHLCPNLCPAGHTTICAEVGISPDEYADGTTIAALQEAVLAAIERLRWFSREQITCSLSHILPVAYVHNTAEALAAVEEIRGKLAAFGVFCIGRYGLWEYISMEDSICSAVAAAERVR